MLSGLKLLVRLSLTVSNIFRYKPIILENYRPNQFCFKDRNIHCKKKNSVLEQKKTMHHANV